MVSKSRTDRILVYSYQLHCSFLGLFGTLLSFQRSSNLVRVFFHQGYDFDAILYVGAMVFQPTSLQTIFFRSFPVRHPSALYFLHFLANFKFLHTVYILKLFSTAFQSPSMLVMFFSPTPDIIPKFDYYL